MEVISQLNNCDLHLLACDLAFVTMSDNRAWAAGAGEGPAVHCVQGYRPVIDMQFGRYCAELQEGAVYRHWPGKTRDRGG